MRLPSWVVSVLIVRKLAIKSRQRRRAVSFADRYFFSNAFEWDGLGVLGERNVSFGLAG